jgi:hypothetical protein
MNYIKKFRKFYEGVFSKYDEDILENFVDLDEIFDVDISCENGTVKIKFDNIEKSDRIFQEIWDRIVRMRNIGEFETNPVYGGFFDGNWKYMEVFLKSEINRLNIIFRDNNYMITLGDKDLSNIENIYDQIGSKIRKTSPKVFGNYRWEREQEIIPKSKDPNWIKDNSYISKIVIEIKPN